MHGFSLDHICLKDGQIFFYGWGFNIDQDVDHIFFRYLSHDNITRQVPVNYGRARSDVSQNYPNIPNANNCGFLLLTGLEANKIKECFLDWYFIDGSKESLKIELQEHSDKLNFKDVALHLVTNANRVLDTLKRAGLRTTYLKIKRYIAKKPTHLSKSEWDELKVNLQNKDITIIVDHDMGGGANIFRQNLIECDLVAKKKVILLSYHVPSLQFFLQVFSDESSSRFHIDSPNDIFDLISLGRVRHVYYNCAVTFRRPLNIPELLLSIKLLTDCTIVVAIHDYFVACPSHFLLNNQNNFCGIPDIETCKSCLKSHTDGFVMLTNCKDISEWRLGWSKLLNQANEVRLFSKSSFTLMKKAFPELETSTWTIKPHLISNLNIAVTLQPGECLNIGIVGAIGRHKGSEIISAMSKEIESNNLNIKITVIGTIEAICNPNIVSISGTYNSQQLPQLISDSGANIFFLPSICPETFSFVSHELIQMNVPFACFDLGAPADIAREYDKGLVLVNMNPLDVLNQLNAFRKTIYQL